MSLRATNVIYTGRSDSYVGIVTVDQGNDVVDLVYFTGGTMGVATVKGVRRSDKGEPNTWTMPDSKGE